MTRLDVAKVTVLAAVGVTLGLTVPLRAQEAEQVSPDSGRVHQLETLVVTAERAAAPMAAATSAVTSLSGQELRRRPLRTLADAVQQAPGLTFVDFDGLGLDPQPLVRGFYGGGEAEYLLLLLDGRPLNNLETGRATWDLVPLGAIESIEIVRGGASAAWGDAALGGVVNLITRRSGGRALRATVTGGSYGLLRGSASLSDVWRGRDVALFGNYNRSDGFRTHADRSTGGAGASIALVQTPERTLSVSGMSDWRSIDEPGPLGAAALAESRTQVAPFYRFDHVSERLHRMSLDGSMGLGGTGGGAARASASLAGDYRHSDRVRTLPLAPDYADTKHRKLATARLLATAQLEVGELPLPGADDLLIGLDASVGRVTSKYYDVMQGDGEAYAGAAPTRGDLAANGAGTRTALAGFVRYGLDLVPALRLSVGGRIDWLDDGFDARAPSGEAHTSADHVAFSPKIGANVRYLSSEVHEGHVYATVARSFKAPTPDQLFDQRPIPVPFPPFAITFANADLKPQYGTNVEVGVYHRAVLVPELLSVDVTAAVYHLSLRDELDFSLETFRYENIGKSRHRGIETGLNVRGPGSLAVFGNYTLQAATSRVGEHSGMYLKAIPRHVWTGGVTAGASTGPAASLLVTAARKAYLDDANTQELPAWTRWDARLSYAIGRVRLGADVFNLLDRKYSTTGFPDPADPSVVYYYPAAGRTLQVGLSHDW